MNSNLATKTIQMCRTCLKEITNTLDLTGLTIRQKLSNCIPELDLSFTTNTVICRECAEAINSMYKFKMQCLRLEMQIYKYIHEAQHAGDVDLVEFAQFNRRYGMNIKVEAFEIEEQPHKPFVVPDDLKEITKTEYLPMEKVDVKCVLLNTDCESVTNDQKCLFPFYNHQNSNKTDISYQCYMCGHRTESELTLVLHIKSHKRNLHCYKCYSCNYSTKYKCFFSYHSRTHLTKKNYKRIRKNTRTDCSKPKDNSSQTKKFKCTFCEYRSNRKYAVKLHTRIHTGEKPFKCSICEKNYTRNKGLEVHMLTHTGQKPFICSICGYQCSQKYTLKTHQLIHTGSKPFICSVCNNRFNQKGSLTKHMQIHKEEKLFKCSICEYQTNEKGNLNRHMRSHTQEKPFECPVCKNQYRSKQNLQRHMQVHAGEKTFSCSICEYYSVDKWNLKSHMLIHTQEKPFVCLVCKKRFRRKQQLKYHVLIHTGEKPFKCSVCEHQCRHPSDLKKHMQIHTVGKK